jgi:hypothetical protein
VKIFPWNFMKYFSLKFSMEFFMEFHGISWNSMTFRGKFHELTERFSPGNGSRAWWWPLPCVSCRESDGQRMSARGGRESLVSFSTHVHNDNGYFFTRWWTVFWLARPGLSRITRTVAIH